MAFWNTIKKGAEGGLDALREGVTTFVAGAEKQGKVLKKKVELAAVQSNMRKTFISLGTAVYDLQAQGDQEILGQAEVQRLMKKIDEEQGKVREIESAIEVISQEEEHPNPPDSSEKTPPPPT